MRRVVPIRHIYILNRHVMRTKPQRSASTPACGPRGMRVRRCGGGACASLCVRASVRRARGGSSSRPIFSRSFPESIAPQPKVSTQLQDGSSRAGGHVRRTRGRARAPLRTCQHAWSVRRQQQPADISRSNCRLQLVRKRELAGVEKKKLTALLGRGEVHALLACALPLACEGHERDGGAHDHLLQVDEKL